MGTTVVACCDTTPVLEAAEGIFDAVALAVEGFVVVDHDRAVFARWNAGVDALCCQRRPEAVAVIAPVTEQFAAISNEPDVRTVYVFQPGPRLPS